MSESEIAALELRIQASCPVKTVLRQSDPKPGKGTVRLICANPDCRKQFWTNPYRLKVNTKFCSRPCADTRRGG